MSGPDNEKRRPLGTDGADDFHDTSLNAPNIPGITEAGEGEGLVSGGVA